MRISIALCTYNGSQHLQKQLDTFASQTYPPYELIVCDDGSTDATLSLLETLAGKVSFPVRIFKNDSNLGSTKNFEKAIGICDGELIALSDQDDEWHPDKLARMHHLFEELPKALAAFSDADIIDDDSSLAGRKLWKSIDVDFSPGENAPYVDTGLVSSLFKRDYIATGATMVFRSRLRDQFAPIPGSWPHDAWIAWIAALRDGLVAFPAATIRYRVHARQQLGVRPPSLADQIAFARKDAVIFRLIANRLKDLQLYLQQHRDDKQLAKFIPDLNAKIQHLEGRASLTGSVFHRALWVLRSWREYQRYARGLKAMIIDAFIVSGEKSEGKAKQ